DPGAAQLERARTHPAVRGEASAREAAVLEVPAGALREAARPLHGLTAPPRSAPLCSPLKDRRIPSQGLAPPFSRIGASHLKDWRHPSQGAGLHIRPTGPSSQLQPHRLLEMGCPTP